MSCGVSMVSAGARRSYLCSDWWGGNDSGWVCGLVEVELGGENPRPRPLSLGRGEQERTPGAYASGSIQLADVGWLGSASGRSSPREMRGW